MATWKLVALAFVAFVLMSGAALAASIVAGAYS